MAVRDTISVYISEELLDDGAQVENDDNLLADGMVDSIGMLRLIGFIEASWGISVPLEDITIENFRTVESMHQYLVTVAGLRDDGNGSG